MSTVTSHQRRSRAQWRALLERAERSALSITAFCRAEGISTASFYTWRQRLQEASQSLPAGRASPVAAAEAAPSFVDLGSIGARADDDDAARWEIELVLGADIVLRLRRG